MLAAPVACTPTCILLQGSNTHIQRASFRAFWISTSFRAISMSAEESVVSSLMSSASAKFCSKATGKCTLGMGDINKKHEPPDVKCLANKDELTPFQSSAEYEDSKMPSSEIQQEVNEAGIEQSLVTLKDFDSLMKLTVAELRGMMRKLGMPPAGRKHDLILALKKFITDRSADQVSGIDLPKEAEHTSSEVIMDQVRNKGKKSRAKGLLDTSVKESLLPVQRVEDSGSKLDGVEHVLSNCQQKYSRKKRSINVIVQSSSPERVKSITKPTLRKRASLNSEEHTVELTDGDDMDTDMPLEPESGKGLAQKKGKIMKSIGRSKAMGATADIEVKFDFNFEQPWTMLVHKKVQLGWVAYNPTTMRPPSLLDNSSVMRLTSWNVNGLRALLRHEENSVVQLAEKENFDVLCLQETKLQEKDVEQIKQCLLNGYENSFWTCSISKLGYSGTAVISRIKPVSVKFGLGVPDHDSEGRLITMEFNTFYLVAGYVPNSGQKLERLTYRVQQWDPSLSSYIKDLEKQKPVVLTGDLNCAHEEIDIYNPDGNRRNAGFTDEERSSFEVNFLNKGFVDSFRQQHPNKVGYTYWGYRGGARADNRGWRLDYFLVSGSIVDNVYDSYIIPDVNGSDHCPIGLILKL